MLLQIRASLLAQILFQRHAVKTHWTQTQHDDDGVRCSWASCLPWLHTELTIGNRDNCQGMADICIGLGGKFKLVIFPAIYLTLHIIAHNQPVAESKVLSLICKNEELQERVPVSQYEALPCPDPGS